MKYENYVLQLAGAINEVFEEDSEHYIGDLEEIDATMLFTAMLGASTYVFNELTDSDNTLIEMTHTFNSLAVQHVVEKVKGSK
jgi:hypothetical protein